MSFEDIYRSYRHLTNDELKQEIHDRTARRYDVRMVGADGCMIDSYVIKVCETILAERGIQ